MSTTDKDKSIAFHMAMRMYIGETCLYCGHEYTSVEDIHNREVVWAHHKGIDPPINDKGQSLACEECFKKAGS